MAWEDQVLRKTLRGRPSLRRRLASVDEARQDEFVQTTDLDPTRWKDLYRQRLAEFAQTEEAAQPMRQRAALEQARQKGLSSGNTELFNAATERLRRTGGQWGSIEERFNPDRPGSLASRRLPGLYRG